MDIGYLSSCDKLIRYFIWTFYYQWSWFYLNSQKLLKIRKSGGGFGIPGKSGQEEVWTYVILADVQLPVIRFLGGLNWIPYLKIEII